MKKYIGIFDSGIGGLTILEELKRILPNESFIYYKDSSHNPYGEKTDKEIYDICKNIIEELISLNVKLIVIACNTATTICMKRLKEEYKEIIFIGTVPAIKVACDNNYKNILALMTPATYKSKRVEELIEDNKKDYENITLLPCNGLANAIETNDTNKTAKLVNEYLKPYKNKNIDAIVLGCTHYSYIKEDIKNIIPDAVIIDSIKGVTKEVKRQLEINNLLEKSNKQEIQIISK